MAEEIKSIEKNKELFEYEMTEVIIRLKDEFAAISEKCKKKYEDSSVDNIAFSMDVTAIKQVSLEKYRVDFPEVVAKDMSKVGVLCVRKMEGVKPYKMPEIKNINGEIIKFNYKKPIKTSKMTVKVEKIPTINRIEVEDKIIKPIRIQVPDGIGKMVFSLNPVTNEDINVQIPRIKENVGFVLHEIRVENNRNLQQQIKDLLQKTKLATAEKKQVFIIKDNQQKIVLSNVDVPGKVVTNHKIKKVKVKRSVVSFPPQTTIVCGFQDKTITVDNKMNIFIPPNKSCAFRLKKQDVNLIRVAIPTIKPPIVDMRKLEFESAKKLVNLNIPEVKTFEFKPNTIKVESVKVSKVVKKKKGNGPSSVKINGIKIDTIKIEKIEFEKEIIEPSIPVWEGPI